jgi:hypothetical protein
VNQSWIRFKVPDNQWLAFKQIPTYSVLGRMWFYVSPQNSYVYFSNNAKDQPAFFDPRGNRVAAEKVNDLNLYRVNAGSANGAWWSIDATEYKSIQFYDRAQLFFPYDHVRAADQRVSSH